MIALQNNWQFSLKNRHSLNNTVLKLLADNDIELTDEISDSVKEDLCLALNVSKTRIGNVITCLREQTGKYPRISENEFVEIKRPSIIPLHQICIENNFIRNSPKTERHACDVMCNAIIRTLPIGGKALLTGTPTAIAACENQETRCDTILDDNKEVAICLIRTTDEQMIISVGTGMDEEKGRRKAIDWKSFSSTRGCKVVIGIVDSESFKREVEKLAIEQKKKNSIAKVVLLTSGVWVDNLQTKTKRGKLDCNFEQPSIELTNEYDNLHILAMTREGLFKYYVRYLHNGKNIILNP